MHSTMFWESLTAYWYPPPSAVKKWCRVDNLIKLPIYQSILQLNVKLSVWKLNNQVVERSSQSNALNPIDGVLGELCTVAHWKYL